MYVSYVWICLCTLRYELDYIFFFFVNCIRGSYNQATNQSINQSNQPTKQPTNKPTKQPASQPTNELANHKNHTQQPLCADAEARRAASVYLVSKYLSIYHVVTKQNKKTIIKLKSKEYNNVLPL